MQVLITGASGFVGEALISALLKDAHSIIGLSRNPGRKALDKNVHWAGYDDLPKVLAETDAVINVAGSPVATRWTEDKKKEIYSSRVEGTDRLVAAMKASTFKPKVLVSASAVGYYGDRGEEVLTEESAPGDDFLARVCVDWEAKAHTAAALGIREVRVRIGLVLDRGGGMMEKMLPAFKLGVGGRLGRGDQYMPWIHRVDLAALFVEAIKNDAWEGPINGVAPNPVTNKVFTKTLGRRLKRPTFLPAPKAAVKLAFGEASDAILGGQRAVPARAERLGFEFIHPELGSALSAIV